MTEYVTFLHDVFALFGPITARKMFGGYGIYHDGLMFALVADDTLYLKTDAENAGDFKKRELEPFTYRKGGKVITMSYYLAPDEILEDRAQAAAWAQRAWEAARRSHRLKRTSKGSMTAPPS